MDIVIIAVAVMVVIIAMQYISKRPPLASADGQLLTLKPHWIYPAIGWICLCLALVILILAVAQWSTPAHDIWAIVGLEAIFGGLGGIIVNDARSRVVLTPAAIEAFSAWRGPISIKWQDITAVDYAAVNRWFIVRDRAGTVVRVSSMYIGIEALIDRLRTKLPANIYEIALKTYGRN